MAALSARVGLASEEPEPLLDAYARVGGDVQPPLRIYARATDGAPLYRLPAFGYCFDIESGRK